MLSTSLRTSAIALNLKRGFKSGTTNNQAIVFAVQRTLPGKMYGQEEANKRIYASTDRQKALLAADANGWEMFVFQRHRWTLQY